MNRYSDSRKMIPPVWEAFMAVGGFILLILAVLLDKHSIVLKLLCSTAVQLVVLLIAVSQFRRRLLDEKRIVYYAIILGCSALHAFFFIDNSLWVSLRYIHTMYAVACQIPAAILAFTHSVVDVFAPTLRTKYDEAAKGFDFVAFFGILLTMGLVFFYSPLTVHASDPESLPFSMGPLFLWHALYFLLATGIAYLFYVTSSRPYRAFVAPVFAIMAVTAWVYTYILPGDYGVLDVTVFSHPGRLIGFDRLYGLREKFLQIAEITGLTVFGAGAYYLIRKFPKPAGLILIVLNCMTFGQTAANLISRPEAWSAVQGAESSYLPDSAGITYRLSRERNVLLIMMDMFCGGFVPEIFDSYPELESSFGGFVWYPNTISLGTATFAGLPGILGGEDFAPHKVNAEPGKLMSERLSEAYGVYSEAFNSRGFDTVYVNPVYYNLEEEAEDRNVTVVQPEVFAEYWINTDDEAAELDLRFTSGEYSRLFSIVGFFKAAPYFFRPYIYTDGRWLNFNRGTLEIRTAVNHLSFLSLLSRLSTVDGDKPTFKYIGNEFTHVPWAIDENLNLMLTAGGGRRYFPEYDFFLIEKERPYHAAARAMHELAAYFDWMRVNGVFDVSKIVIVSDHGYYGPSPMWPDLPLLRADDGAGVEGSGAYHSILMVKDFDSVGKFGEDDRLMSTADTASIVLSALEDEKWVALDPTRGAPRSREVYTTLTPVPPEENDKDRYIIQYQFSVKQDPSNPDNWTQMLPQP